MFTFFYAASKSNILFPSDELTTLFNQTKQEFTFETLIATLFFHVNKSGRYLAMNYPYWSLFHEACFYLLAPFLMKKLRLAVFISLGLFIMGFFYKLSPLNMFGVFWLSYLFYFMLGMAFYELIAKGPVFQIKKWYWLPIIVFFGISLFSQFLVGYRLSYLLAAIVALFAVHQIVFSKKITTKILNPICFLGKISFSLYLIHIPTYIFLTTLLQQWIKIDFSSRFYFIPVLIAVIVSYVFYLLIEQPSLKIIQRLKLKMNFAQVVKRPKI